MPNVTTPIPSALTKNNAEDIKRLKEWGTALIDELTYLFANLDAGNVREAASVKAENINTANARITNAQIGTLSADKLTAGTVDTNRVKVESEDGTLLVSGSAVTLSDHNQVRCLAGLDSETGEFRFLLCNKLGVPTVSVNSSGDAVFSGQVEGSSIYASTIIGTDSQSYADATGGVFAQTDKAGIKIMQDKNGIRQQKLGMSVANDGTAYMVLGAGNGEGSHTINGVVYTNGSFKIEKNDAGATLGLVGYAPQISLWENGGELWLSGSRVLINGVDLESKYNALQTKLTQLEQRVAALAAQG